MYSSRLRRRRRRSSILVFFLSLSLKAAVNLVGHLAVDAGGSEECGAAVFGAVPVRDAEAAPGPAPAPFEVLAPTLTPPPSSALPPEMVVNEAVRLEHLHPYIRSGICGRIIRSK